MNLNQDKQNSFISTVDAETLTAFAYTLKQYSYNRITLKAMCINQSTGQMYSLKLTSCIQRDSGAGRIAGEILIMEETGDLNLASSDVEMQVSGGVVNINVIGIEGMKLDWCIQFEIDILTSDSIEPEIKG